MQITTGMFPLTSLIHKPVLIALTYNLLNSLLVVYGTESLVLFKICTSKRKISSMDNSVYQQVSVYRLCYENVNVNCKLGNEEH